MKPPIKPVTRSKSEARASYNRLSRWYDWLAGSSEKKFRQLGLQLLDARTGELVLEIGVGTGHALLSLATAVGPTGQVYGLDISERMLAITHERLRRAGLAERVALCLGDGAHLPFTNGRFDAMFMSFTLELFDTAEIPRLLQQCRAALRPNGRIVTVSLVKKQKTAVRLYEWFHEKLPVLLDCRPIYAQAELAQAGFTVHQQSRLSMWGLPVEILLARRS
jgi:ubiquinone/menaquinone biosynthesis C-methylase UbiE